MLRSKCCLDRIGIVRAGQVLTIARPRMRSRAEPALLPCRDAPPGQLVAGPAWRGSRAFRGPGASEEIANAVGRRVALAARRRAVGIDVQMLVDDRKQVRALLVDPVKCR